MKISNKIWLCLLAVIVGFALWGILPGIWGRMFPAPPSESSLPFSYQETFEAYLRSEILSLYGEAEAGEYHFNRYGDSGEIQHARQRSGVVSVLIEDIWGDSVPEMLTVTLVPSTEQFEYSQVSVDVYEYERKSGDVFHVASLTQPVTVGEKTLFPLRVTGAEDAIKIFFLGDYLCLESMSAGEEATHTITVYHKDYLDEDPEFILCACREKGYPLGYYLYEKGGAYRSLFDESEGKEGYLEEFLNGNETPVSEEALSYLLSSIKNAEEYLKGKSFSPLWEEEENLVWVDGRTGHFTLAGEEVRLLTTYENHLEAAEGDPNQPAVQIVTDYTKWK